MLEKYNLLTIFLQNAKRKTISVDNSLKNTLLISYNIPNLRRF